ncbi:helix-turn-helix domain-containing protein [uncultured Maritimibacter sp.]|uniref:helix-turn-helix domain-containing protein n=1 Tax=uncultured Maritimibacter sp. TaxID=991866 RepID=UPI002606C566|nr:helix-turn-helix domain-containing protein [uncultured Maritimibacter sp.]
MPETRLTGSRIRERRLAQGVRQADLARDVGISPAYLNLIEHNRRRIGGKLLVDLARHLDVEPSQLSQGAGQALVTGLRDAAARVSSGAAVDLPERERAEDFAGRFPGWAGLVTAQARRIDDLERVVETLSDRLTHDPHLAASLHEVISTVTAIRSTAAILADTADIDPDWQARFLRNMREEAQRLSHSASGLVNYLDAGADAREMQVSAVDDMAAMVEAAQYHFPPLEKPAVGEGELALLLDGAEALRDRGARDLARMMLVRYLADARAMPERAFRASLDGAGGDPVRLAAGFGVGLDAVLRRMASLSEAGLVVCDGSGTITLRKPVEGFPLPRFGAACPLWPLYQALGRPAQPVVQVVEMPGREGRLFRCVAVSLPRPAASIDEPPVQEATMLIEPLAESPGRALGVGTSCRICPRETCGARREPSILGARL